ncbi:DUF3515 domain-containing protein [Agrococcus versicolor]|uniref:DUF3515 domain-containing protein n=1 Tax=Agrococcus versicolor TaxID=501482 RepID=A0ABN3ATP7_9MICO
MRRTSIALALAGLAAATLSACTSTVSLQVADDATDPLCASVIVSLPETIGASEPGGPFDERPTDAQATAAWGDPAAVTLRCGVPVPDPSTATCATVGGVDWIDVTAEGSEVRTLVTYGREPAVELVIDPERLSASTALGDVSSAVDRTDEVGACISPADAP